MHPTPHELRELASRLSCDIDQRLLFGDTTPEEHDILASASEQAKRLLKTLDRAVGVWPAHPTVTDPPAPKPAPTLNEFARAEAAKSAAPEWARKFFTEYAASPPEAKPGYLEVTSLVRKIEDLARRTAALEAKFAGPVKV